MRHWTLHHAPSYNKTMRLHPCSNVQEFNTLHSVLTFTRLRSLSPEVSMSVKHGACSWFNFSSKDSTVDCTRDLTAATSSQEAGGPWIMSPRLRSGSDTRGRGRGRGREGPPSRAFLVFLFPMLLNGLRNRVSEMTSAKRDESAPA